MNISFIFQGWICRILRFSVRLRPKYSVMPARGIIAQHPISTQCPSRVAGSPVWTGDIKAEAYEPSFFFRQATSATVSVRNRKILLYEYSQNAEFSASFCVNDFNTLRPRQNGRHFENMKIFTFWLRFHWSLLTRVQLTIFQNWFR